MGFTTPNDPKLWPPGPLKVTRKRALPIAMCDRLNPWPSMETNRSILPFSVSLKRRLTPRRSPRPSSPTVPTNVTVPGVATLALFNALATASTSASPRQSSPIPGPRSTYPSRRTLTLVPRGNTVSRWALTTRFGRAFAPGRSPMTFPSASRRTFVSPTSRNIAAYSSARFAS